ncbi:type II CRISPR RNA-guided endonuclease Cas9, partial [Helicobacter ganmani]|uniref:type II CRISPR RNA-guided endonuclease Cas9 n=3 Tax=Helicobacter TaxID=209 RepID=UPI003A882072
GVRRRLARRKVRLNAIKRLLCKEFGLNLSDYFANDGELPKAYETTKDTKSPYELRTLALSQKLEVKDLARVILHIAKHRGYGNKHAKSDLTKENKIKEEIKEEQEKQKVALKTTQDKNLLQQREILKKEQELVLKALYRNEAALESCKVSDKYSVGKYFYESFEKRGQRIRNTTNNYQHTMRQEWLKDELEFIFKKQKDFGATFSKNFESQIIETAFYQRDLKSFEDKVGKCVFYENENRAPKDSLSAMEFVALTRIINTLKNLEKKSKNLGIGETYGKDKIQEILKNVFDKGEMSYKELRKILKLNESILFAKDSKLDYTKGMQEAEKAKFIELKNLKAFKKAMGGDFSKFPREELDKIATDITLIKSKENLAKKLQNYSALSKEQVEALSNLNFAKHIDLSLKALDKILRFMREGLSYDEAVKKAGLQEHRKHKQKGEFLIPLKDYEPYLANPVVARALSEYRKVLNALLRKYGNVHKIHLEFTREAKLSAKERQKYEKEQKEHFEANQKAKKQCEILGLPINGANILKMKLWIEQGECCVYSGEKITREHFFDSNALQVDHIYPYSRSFDDSYMNKVLVFAKENQNKLNKTPFEAFGNNKEKWDRILSLSANLPKQKQRRISNKDFKDKELGFIARNINDTGYIARLASQWTN